MIVWSIPGPGPGDCLSQVVKHYQATAFYTLEGGLQLGESKLCVFSVAIVTQHIACKSVSLPMKVILNGQLKNVFSFQRFSFQRFSFPAAVFEVFAVLHLYLVSQKYINKVVQTFKKYLYFNNHLSAYVTISCNNNCNPPD